MHSAHPTMTAPEVMAGTVLVPPPIRRGEGARSGAPSGMMAQTQPHRDVTSAAVRPTLRLTRRKPRSGRIGGGEDLW